MVGLLYTIAMIFFIMWIAGFVVFHVGGSLIHLLLVVALVAVVFNLLTGRRTV